MAKSKRKLTVFGKVLITMIGILFLVLCVLLSQLVIQLTKPEEKAPSEQEKVAQEETKEIEFSDREKAYADAHPELSEEEVIKRVAMNLDQEPYSNLQEVQDLDSDLQLVNKYYSLPSDYEPADLVPVSSSGEREMSRGVTGQPPAPPTSYPKAAQAHHTRWAHWVAGGPVLSPSQGRPENSP